MKFYPRYKTFLAGILLLLYGFISLPVILWHQHGHTDVWKNISKQNTTQSEFKINEAASTSCSVCDHEYATYTDEHGFRFISVVLSRQPAAATTIRQLTRYERANGLYRGPPAL